MAKAPDGFYVATDTQITVQGLKDTSGQYVNDATVTGVLKDRAGKIVTGCDHLVFVNVADSDGDYTGTIPATAPLKEASEYDLVLSCTKSDHRMTITYRRSAAMLYA